MQGHQVEWQSSHVQQQSSQNLTDYSAIMRFNVAKRLPQAMRCNIVIELPHPDRGDAQSFVCGDVVIGRGASRDSATSFLDSGCVICRGVHIRLYHVDWSTEKRMNNSAQTFHRTLETRGMSQTAPDISFGVSERTTEYYCSTVVLL